MAGVFSKQRFGFASQTTIEELKVFSKNPNTVKSTSFWLNVWETWCKQKNIVNKIEENEPEKLNKLLVYRRSNEDQAGRTAEQEQRFSAKNVLC